MSKAKVMIVEDEWVIAEDLSQCLKGMDYEITSIETSGEEAIKRAGEEKPDLVLMDIVLREEMSGIDTAREIYSRFNIPHIFVTAYANKDILEQAKTTEPFGYLIKPYNEHELHASIEIALYKHRMEERLRKSEEKYREIVEGTNDLITRVNKHGEFLFVNNVSEKIFGLRADQCTGRLAFQFIHPDDRRASEIWFK